MMMVMVLLSSPLHLDLDEVAQGADVAFDGFVLGEDVFERTDLLDVGCERRLGFVQLGLEL
jgi:hypothetical protein